MTFSWKSNFVGIRFYTYIIFKMLSSDNQISYTVINAMFTISTTSFTFCFLGSLIHNTDLHHFIENTKLHITVISYYWIGKWNFREMEIWLYNIWKSDFYVCKDWNNSINILYTKMIIAYTFTTCENKWIQSLPNKCITTRILVRLDDDFID